MPDYLLVSADSHVNEVPATWARVQHKHGDRAPRVVWNPSPDEPGPYLVIDGWTSPTSGQGYRATCTSVGMLVGGSAQMSRYSAEANEFRRNFRFEDYPGMGLDPAARIADMERDGVEAEVLYSSHLRHVYEMSAQDEPFFHDIAESYNEWLMDFTSYDPRRSIAQPLISVLNPEGAAADIRAYARRGARGFMIAASVPRGCHYGADMFDPIWAAAQECDVPLAMHSGTGRWKQPTYAHADIRNFVGGQVEVQTSLAEMIYGHVFDRFPALKIISAEFEIGWVGFNVQRVRALDRHFRHGADRRGLQLSPVDYLQRNVWFTFEDDRAGCLTIPTFGENRFMWASDYPHGFTTWPNSHAIVDRQLAGLPDEIKRRVARQNVIDLYGLDLA